VQLSDCLLLRPFGKMVWCETRVPDKEIEHLAYVEKSGYSCCLYVQVLCFLVQRLCGACRLRFKAAGQPQDTGLFSNCSVQKLQRTMIYLKEKTTHWCYILGFQRQVSLTETVYM